MNIKDAKSAQPLMEEIISNNYSYVKVFDENSDFKYFSPSTEDEIIFKVLENQDGRIVNFYPNISHLFRKDEFKSMMQMAVDMDLEDTFDFVPPSFNLPVDTKKYEEYTQKNPGATYIAKPLAGA